MKKGTLVRITHQCVPQGLIPDTFGILLYEFGNENKWYAIEVKWEEVFSNFSIRDLPSIDSHRIFMLKPEKEKTELSNIINLKTK